MGQVYEVKKDRLAISGKKTNRHGNTEGTEGSRCHVVVENRSIR
jgi:hypothetical protein